LPKGYTGFRRAVGKPQRPIAPLDFSCGQITCFFPPDGLQPAENDMVAVELEGYGQWKIKRLKILGPGKVELVSANKDHPPIKINIDNEKLEVKGILLRTVRKFKKRLFLK